MKAVKEAFLLSASEKRPLSHPEGERVDHLKVLARRLICGAPKLLKPFRRGHDLDKRGTVRRLPDVKA